MLNLDTHILVSALAGDSRAAERRLLSENTWGISAIVLWELAKLRQLKRIDLDIRDADVTRLLSRIHIWPLDLGVCRAMMELDFRSDPAAEIIAATSVFYRVPLVTRDTGIRRSKVVPLARLR
jgi:PIN domain nuclease of toxin-antitoxin system